MEKTMWTAKQIALNRIVGNYDKFNNALSTELIIPLSKIYNNESYTPDLKLTVYCHHY